MERRFRTGHAITPDEFEELADAQLERLVPRRYQDYYGGKEACEDGFFYLHGGRAYSFSKGGLLDE